MAEASTELLTTADGRPLKEALAIAQSRAKRRAFLLVLPLLLFVLLTFLIPIGYMLKRSVEHDGFARSAPALVEWFEANPGFDYANPPEEAYAALVKDLTFMQTEKLTGLSGTRINYTVPGTISLFKAGARAAKDLQAPYKEALLAVDAEWARPALWRGMEAASSKFTTEFYKVGTDNKLGDNGWERGGDKDRIYLYLFFKTFLVSGIITVICLLLAFPVAHLLAVLPMSRSSLLMILVLLPFWTSLLVRTTSWIALLQEQGILNDLLVWLGVVGDDNRIAAMYNMTGTIVAMTHVLLPFMILPLYSVMRVIPPSYARAARSLGATSWTTFRRVYLPQTLPGIAAGSLLVFILAVGYYITPALVGGADGQLISNLISFHMTKSNWSLAAALAAMLLAAILLLYWLYDRLIGIDRLKLG
ncbi:ABC transporter permease [Tabrizicola oligotrophica]|uniref:ABC transporter permease n=1 Tax=Tabrizicola oligotrophica TaxID=2710650 RepID=A0A6M0QYK5_9RHOB|nr:ABC transporter permease subunit [Tabrizicola oligotrophica]NEY91923.1 ABC transporter permease [Tabrizicola oligotrophica]